MQTLIKLDLEYNQVSGEGIQYLSQALITNKVRGNISCRVHMFY